MRVTLNELLAVLLIGAATGPALAGQTYYVRVTGNDASSGTSPANAFATIQHAVAQTSGPGNIIYVGPGTYTEAVYVGEGAGSAASSGNSSNHNQLIGDVTGSATGDPAGAVIIDGQDSEQYGLRFYQRNYWDVSFLTLQNQTSYNVSGESADDLTFGNMVLYASPFVAVSLYECDDCSVVDNTFIRDGTDGYGISYYDCQGDSIISRNRLYHTGALYLSTPWKDGTTDWTGPGQIVEDAMGIIYLFSDTASGSVVVENNILSDYYMGIWVATYGGSTSGKVAHNAVSGCRYAVFAWGYYGPITVYDHIATDCYRGMGLIAYYTTISSDGFLHHDLNSSTYWQYGAVTASNTSSGDPLWVNPPYGAYALRASSPAIDAGQDSSTAVDIRGESRPLDGDGVGGAVDDYGPYEFNATEDHPVVVQWTEVPR